MASTNSTLNAFMGRSATRSWMMPNAKITAVGGGAGSSSSSSSSSSAAAKGSATTRPGGLRVSGIGILGARNPFAAKTSTSNSTSSTTAAQRKTASSSSTSTNKLTTVSTTAAATAATASKPTTPTESNPAPRPSPKRKEAPAPTPASAPLPPPPPTTRPPAPTSVVRNRESTAPVSVSSSPTVSLRAVAEASTLPSPAPTASPDFGRVTSEPARTGAEVELQTDAQILARKRRKLSNGGPLPSPIAVTTPVFQTGPNAEVFASPRQIDPPRALPATSGPLVADNGSTSASVSASAAAQTSSSSSASAAVLPRTTSRHPSVSRTRNPTPADGIAAAVVAMQTPSGSIPSTPLSASFVPSQAQPFPLASPTIVASPEAVSVPILQSSAAPQHHPAAAASSSSSSRPSPQLLGQMVFTPTVITSNGPVIYQQQQMQAGVPVHDASAQIIVTPTGAIRQAPPQTPRPTQLDSLWHQLDMYVSSSKLQASELARFDLLVEALELQDWVYLFAHQALCLSFVNPLEIQQRYGNTSMSGVNLLVDLTGGQPQKPSQFFLTMFSEFPLKRNDNWELSVHWQCAKQAVKIYLDGGYEMFQSLRQKCADVRNMGGHPYLPTAETMYQVGFRSQIFQRLAFTSIRRSIGLLEGTAEWVQWDSAFRNSLPLVFSPPTKLSPTSAAIQERIEKNLIAKFGPGAVSRVRRPTQNQNQSPNTTNAVVPTNHAPRVAQSPQRAMSAESRQRAMQLSNQRLHTVQQIQRQNELQRRHEQMQLRQAQEAIALQNINAEFQRRSSGSAQGGDGMQMTAVLSNNGISYVPQPQQQQLQVRMAQTFQQTQMQFQQPIVSPSAGYFPPNAVGTPPAAVIVPSNHFPAPTPTTVPGPVVPQNRSASTSVAPSPAPTPQLPAAQPAGQPINVYFRSLPILQAHIDSMTLSYETEVNPETLMFPDMPLASGKLKKFVSVEFDLADKYVRRLCRGSKKPYVDGTKDIMYRQMPDSGVIVRLKMIKAGRNGAEPTDEEFHLADTAWPSTTFFANLNGNTLEVQRRKDWTRDFPRDITHLVRPGKNKLEFSFLKYDPKESYYFKVEILVAIRIDACINIISKPERKISFEDAKQKLYGRFRMSDSDDLMVSADSDSLTIPLTCPYDFNLISIPVRTKSCQHPQCFDLRNHFLSNAVTRDKDPVKLAPWKCPICSVDARLHRLQIDELFAVRIEEARKVGAKKLVVKADGSYSLEGEEKTGGSGGGGKKAKEPEVIVLDDDDD